MDTASVEVKETVEAGLAKVSFSTITCKVRVTEAMSVRLRKAVYAY
jgi:hypothetical protein